MEEGGLVCQICDAHVKYLYHDPNDPYRFEVCQVCIKQLCDLTRRTTNFKQLLNQLIKEV